MLYEERHENRWYRENTTIISVAWYFISIYMIKLIIILCVLKIAKQNKFQFYFCRMLHLTQQIANSFFNGKERLFTCRERIVASKSFSCGDRGMALFLQLSHRLTTSLNPPFFLCATESKWPPFFDLGIALTGSPKIKLEPWIKLNQ